MIEPFCRPTTFQRHQGCRAWQAKHTLAYLAAMRSRLVLHDGITLYNALPCILASPLTPCTDPPPPVNRGGPTMSSTPALLLVCTHLIGMSFAMTLDQRYVLLRKPPLCRFLTTARPATPTLAASPAAVFNAAVKQSATLRALAIYVLCASCFTLTQLIMSNIYESADSRDTPRLSPFGKSK